ncbi:MULTISPECIES: BspA family leucine-rich repeat surface protein [unclassified Enterococcus]|uniref:mucin-binding protein n=1 Tax=unclassified Enterococcus TaxID=2608891 RepID=UPI001554F652|nr:MULTISPECIES: BspA family leucine-rich repeat surface protein [unclassified Enterococcus]MBS7577582.1 BspA family leucine-rich repeat surface protein [Enterococcus sp. MMGLQ5-2]MBS7584919.1 BspA family leucine-rich repeat surface protein [Enterococcus sp. MMGLQ5-1]NPD12774.1 BspA family leucine-rich repeat surface protein [Enterococcus sp. MMGLQ5-1]NPD37415.1 BspA family leucine-rich repeat surface protein [Enterococcus sp. MMGLQ5-2]
MKKKKIFLSVLGILLILLNVFISSSSAVLANDDSGGVSSTEESASDDGSTAFSVATLANSVVASGTFGTSKWEIDSTGTLTINEGQFSDNLLNASPWKSYIDQINRIVFAGNVKAASNSQYLFFGLKNVTNIENLNLLDTSNVTSMLSMFAACSSLVQLDLSNFKTSKVTNMGSLFYYCKALKNLDLSSFDTSSVTYSMLSMFRDTNLTSLDLSNFDTSKVTNMGGMFYNCPNLTDLDLSSFDTSKVTNMANIFTGTLPFKLTLGKNFKFGINSNLPEITKTSDYTGNWRNIGTGTAIDPAGSNVWHSTDLMNNYNGSIDFDTYVWEPVNQTIKFDANGGTTEQTSITGKTDATIDLTDVKSATRDGYTFNGWYTDKTGGTKLPDSITMPAGGMTYYAQWTVNQESATVSYIDDTTNTIITTDNLSGPYGTTDEYRTKPSIDNYINNGYEFVSDNYPSDGVVYNQSGIVQKFEVHLKHATKIETESQVITQTIHYDYANGDKALDDYTATLDFNRSVTTDLVTNNKTYGDWEAKTNTVFLEVESPAITGYTPNPSKINAIESITGDSLNKEATVIYTANIEHATVSYIDDTTGNVLSTAQLSGSYGTTDEYRTKPSIDTYKAAGYKFVSDNYPSDGVVYNQSGTVQNFEVHLEHKTSDQVETKTVTRTIHYLYSDGSKAAEDFVNTISFVRTATTDEATGEITYTDWQSVEGTTTFDSVVSPVITGYTPDNSEMPAIDNVSNTTADIDQTVTYHPNTEQATVTYIDDTTGEVLSIDELSGLYGTTDAYRTATKIQFYQDKGYLKVSDDYPSSGIIYDQPSVVKSYTVHLKHAISQSEETHRVTQIIHYIYSDGSQALDDYKANLDFKRAVYTDNVTGLNTYGDWLSLSEATFKQVDSPTIGGYTADQLFISVIENVTGSTEDMAFTVTYKKNPVVDNSSGKLNNDGQLSHSKDKLPQTNVIQTNIQILVGLLILGLAVALGFKNRKNNN